MPSLGTPPQLAELRSSPRSSNTPMTRTSESRCAASAAMSASPLPSAPTMTVRRSRRPCRVHRRTSMNKARRNAISPNSPSHVISAEPGPGEFVACFGKVRNSHGEQKNHRPRRGQAHVLFLMAAEGLDLINIGGLERQQREQRDAENAADVIVGGIRNTRDGPKIKRKADCRDQNDFDHADDAGKNDRRVGLLKLLRRDRKRGGRQRARCRRFRGGARQRLHRRRHRRSRLEYRALFGTRHSC